MADLSDIIERLEKADSPDPRLDAAICVLLQYGGEDTADAQRVRTDDDWPGDLLFEIGDEEFCTPIPALTSSIDAAVSLAERVLPGWVVEHIGQDYSSNPPMLRGMGWCVELTDGQYHSRGQSKSFAIAWLIAILRALQQKGSSKWVRS